jgi:hypothetical protein
MLSADRVVVQFVCGTDNPVRHAVDGQDCPSYNDRRERDSMDQRRYAIMTDPEMLIGLSIGELEALSDAYWLLGRA